MSAQYKDIFLNGKIHFVSGKHTPSPFGSHLSFRHGSIQRWKVGIGPRNHNIPLYQRGARRAVCVLRAGER